MGQDEGMKKGQLIAILKDGGRIDRYVDMDSGGFCVGVYHTVTLEGIHVWIPWDSVNLITLAPEKQEECERCP